MSNEANTGIQEQAPEQDLNIFGLIVALIAEWRLGLLCGAIALLLSMGYIFTLKPQYVSTAVILPQEGQGGGNSLASLFSRSAGPGVLYVGLLKSRGVQDYVIEHANLKQIFHTSTDEQTRDVLTGKSSFTNNANSLLEISVKDGNAQDAARIANAYIDALSYLNASMALQQSSQTTEFFDKQLKLERSQLSSAETQLANTQNKTGLVAPESQTQLGLGAIANVRAQVTQLKVQLSSLLQSATEQNPQVQRLRSQIGQLEAEEHQLERGSESPVGAAPPASQMSQTNLDILRAQREVKYHDTLVSSLASQFETARLNEAFRHSAFQVVDRAVAPEHKAWPPRKPFLLAAILFSIVTGLCAIIAKLLWQRIKSDPEYSSQAARLRNAFYRG